MEAADGADECDGRVGWEREDGGKRSGESSSPSSNGVLWSEIDIGDSWGRKRRPRRGA